MSIRFIVHNLKLILKRNSSISDEISIEQCFCSPCLVLYEIKTDFLTQPPVTISSWPLLSNFRNKSFCSMDAWSHQRLRKDISAQTKRYFGFEFSEVITVSRMFFVARLKYSSNVWSQPRNWNSTFKFRSPNRNRDFRRIVCLSEILFNNLFSDCDQTMKQFTDVNSIEVSFYSKWICSMGSIDNNWKQRSCILDERFESRRLNVIVCWSIIICCD